MNRTELREMQRESRGVWLPPPSGRYRSKSGVVYERDRNGTIRCANPKVRGKAARRAEKRERAAEARRKERRALSAAVAASVDRAQLQIRMQPSMGGR